MLQLYVKPILLHLKPINQLFMKLIILVFACLIINSAYAQHNSPAAVFTGKWVTADKETGYEIAKETIKRIYKEEDNNTWKVSPWSHEIFTLVDSAINSSGKMYECWAVTELTSVAYHTSGEIEHTTTIRYVVYKIQLLDRNTIRLSVSTPYEFKKEGGTPVITKADKMKIEKEYLENKKFKSSFILKRLK
jgi:hypothetical protein